ncbi:MAG: dicarboxylate/amino acid:cation symporter [Oscillospiraceae bacterium]
MTHSFYRSYGFLAAMLACIVLGCAVGAAWPEAVCLEPLGTVFINMMFCLVVPLVFCSLAGSIANTRSRRRAGRILGATLGVFVVTGLLAAFIMLVIVRVFPPVLTPWTDAAAGTVDDPAPLATLLVNFFTVNDFSALLSRRAMLPLIVFSLLFGFSVSACGGPDTVTARVLDDATKCLLKMVSLVSCYAPIAFFGFFCRDGRKLRRADHGALCPRDAGLLPALLRLCAARLPASGVSRRRAQGVRRLRRHILRPAVTALGTCSSVATIPANMEAAEGSGIPHEVADLVLPLGATMHMDGSCFSCVLKVAFLFGVFGLPFEGAGLFAEVLAVAVFSSVAMSGIPGGGYIAEFILCSLFFPDRMAVAYPIAVTIGNLVDPPATMVNAAGDYAASFLVARITEGSGWLERTDGERAA